MLRCLIQVYFVLGSMRMSLASISALQERHHQSHLGLQFRQEIEKRVPEADTSILYTQDLSADGATGSTLILIWPQQYIHQLHTAHRVTN